METALSDAAFKASHSVDGELRIGDSDDGPRHTNPGWADPLRSGECRSARWAASPLHPCACLRGDRRKVARIGVDHPRGRSQWRAAWSGCDPFPPHRGDADRDTATGSCGVVPACRRTRRPGRPATGEGAGEYPRRCRSRLDGGRTGATGRHVALGLRAALFRSGGSRSGGISSALANGARQRCAAPQPRHAGRNSSDCRLQDRQARSAPPSATGWAARRATMQRSFAPARRSTPRHWHDKPPRRSWPYCRLTPRRASFAGWSTRSCTGTRSARRG